jgi:hypothetical protein
VIPTVEPLATALDAMGLHLCSRATPGSGEEPFPAPFSSWGPRPSPDKVPFPSVRPPPPFAPPLFPVSTVEPTCTMAARKGGTARPRTAANAMPASMAATGRNGSHDGRRNRASGDRASGDRASGDRASRAAALSLHAQYPRHT